jgi:hypothetical protein
MAILEIPIISQLKKCHPPHVSSFRPATEWKMNQHGESHPTLEETLLESDAP